MTPLPRPSFVPTLFCPSCGHALRYHSDLGCSAWRDTEGRVTTACLCEWTDNDVAACTSVKTSGNPVPSTPVFAFHDPLCSSEDLEAGDKHCHCALIAIVRAQGLVDVIELERWQSAACHVLAKWEDVADLALGPAGLGLSDLGDTTSAQLGESRAEATLEVVKEMAQQNYLLRSFLIDRHLEEALRFWMETQEENKK